MKHIKIVEGQLIKTPATNFARGSIFNEDDVKNVNCWGFC